MARNRAPITSWEFEESFCAHLRDGLGEQTFAVEDHRVLGEETEDEPRHEVIHVVTAFRFAPLGIVLQKLDIKPVKSAGRPDVKGVFGDLPNSCDAGERQEETEMVGKVLISTGDSFATRQLLGLEVLAVGRQNELCLGLCSRRDFPSAPMSVFVTWPLPHVAI